MSALARGPADSDEQGPTREPESAPGRCTAAGVAALVEAGASRAHGGASPEAPRRAPDRIADQFGPVGPMARRLTTGLAKSVPRRLADWSLQREVVGLERLTLGLRTQPISAQSGSECIRRTHHGVRASTRCNAAQTTLEEGGYSRGRFGLVTRRGRDVRNSTAKRARTSEVGTSVVPDLREPQSDPALVPTSAERAAKRSPPHSRRQGAGGAPDRTSVVSV